MAFIGVDIDGVLSQTVKAYVDFYNAKHKTTYVVDDVNVYSFQKVFGITPEQEFQLHKEFFTSKYSEDLEVIPGSVDAVKQLARHHKLFPITSRPEWQQEQTEVWLKRHYGDCFQPTTFTNSHFDKKQP